MRGTTRPFFPRLHVLVINIQKDNINFQKDKINIQKDNLAFT